MGRSRRISEGYCGCCERKEIEIIEANACPDQINMLARIPPKISVRLRGGIVKPPMWCFYYTPHQRFTQNLSWPLDFFGYLSENVACGRVIERAKDSKTVPFALSPPERTASIFVLIQLHTVFCLMYLFLN